MRRMLPCLILLFAIACGNAPQPAPPTRAALFTPAGERLPSGSLIVVQGGQERAILPDGRSIALAEPQQGSRGAPNGAYGVALAPNGGAFDLALVDYSQNPPRVREIPEGRALINPIILWQPDSSGFAFYDLPLEGNPSSNAGTLYYYNLSEERSRPLLNAEQTGGRRAAALAFSPNGVYLLYSLLSEDAEAIGAQVGAGYVINLRVGQPVVLPNEALIDFSSWLGDSSGFLSLRSDPQTGRGTLRLYRLTRLGEPEQLAAEDESVQLAASAPDGAQIALAVRTAEGLSALRLLSLEDGSMREVHRLEQGQRLTVLLWAQPESIHFGVASAEGERIWRIAPDGDEPTPIAEGQLRHIVR